MAHDSNPDTVSNHQSVSPTAGQHRLRRLLVLIVTGSLGTIVGSYISAELLYLHYPEEPRSISSVYSNTIEAVSSSPLSMSFGVAPTIGFYGPHGLLVIPGALMAIVGAIAYYFRGQTWLLIVAFVGFALWSHNNYLSISALMSV
jgi:hypothetical protein